MPPTVRQSPQPYQQAGIQNGSHVMRNLCRRCIANLARPGRRLEYRREVAIIVGDLLTGREERGTRAS